MRALLLLIIVGAIRADPLQITTSFRNAPLYYGMIANFGKQLVEPQKTNMMLMPSDPYLCDFPDELRNLNEMDIERINTIAPIALFVSVDGCPAEQKARVVLDMQETVSPIFQYLFIYDANSDDRDEFIELKPQTNQTADLDQAVNIVYLPYRQALGLFRALEFQYRQTRLNPRLLGEDNERWTFLLDLELSPAGFLPEEPRISEVNNANFVWFRFVLFSLLILSPCCRAGYLWYASGGRLHWRRNERGRIVGVQYVPPMPYWLGPGRTPEPRPPVSDKLTEEQFEKLPEIDYRPGSHEIEEAAETPFVDVVESEPSEQEEATQIEELDVEVPAEEDGERKTTCTTCSICIDDFEHGEKLTLLPRCKHLFHRECLKPWLMERQGCCPLCKTKVIEGSEEEPASDEEVSRPEVTRERRRSTEEAAVPNETTVDLQMAWSSNSPL